MAATDQENLIRDARQVAVSVCAPVTLETLNVFIAREDNSSEYHSL